MLKLPSLLGKASFSRPSWTSPGASPSSPIPASTSSSLSHALCLSIGVQSREKSPEESTVSTRRRTPSDSHYEKSSPEPGSPRSPTVLSPEVVSTIAANPGGRPKEVRWVLVLVGRGKAGRQRSGVSGFNDVFLMGR